jgi:DNA-binding NarL/FixJ family response regulator
MGKIPILVVDDHAVVRQGLRALLENETDMEVVGEAAEGREAVSKARKLLPEVVIMDVSMPTMNGLEATKEILRFLPGVKVVILTTYGDQSCVSQLTEAGAVGYLTKQTAANELVRAIREVCRGNAFYSPEIARHLRDQARARAGAGYYTTRRSTELTERESQVVQLIAEGFSNREIAGKLQISVKTVAKHRQSVMNKLNIHEVASLTRYVVSKRVLEPPASDSRPE